MGNWKEILTRSLIILLASALVVIGFQMLASDQIADGAASTTAVQSTDNLADNIADDGEERMSGDMPAFLGSVVSFVKVFLFIGIPFAITLGVLALTRKIGAARELRQMPGGESA